MRTSEQTNEIAAALATAQGEMTNAALSAINPHFKSAYAKLEDIWDACRTPLSKHHLAVIQFAEYNDGRVIITTRLEHKSGQWYEGSLSLKSKEDSPHAFGSAITYGRRYCLMAIVGIAPGETDDDGNASSGKKEISSQKPKEIPKETPREFPKLLPLTSHEVDLCIQEMTDSNNVKELSSAWAKWCSRINISSDKDYLIERKDIIKERLEKGKNEGIKECIEVPSH